jgi:uncharacterized phage protein (TIGR01671 family)
MREILFKGKTNSGNWVYGNLVYSDNLQTAIYFEVGNGSVKSFDWAYVLPETVEQFTGLTDKNGVKVFEGDLIKSVANGITEVRYDQQKAAFILYSKKPGYWDFSVHACSDKVVIGNIHDNKNLLEGKND